MVSTLDKKFTNEHGKYNENFMTSSAYK